MGHFQVRPEMDENRFEPKLQDIWPDGGGHTELGMGELGRALGYNFNETNWLEGKRSDGQEVFNERPYTKNCAEAQSLAKNGVGSDRKMEVVIIGG